jgi:hypothetical protein
MSAQRRWLRSQEQAASRQKRKDRRAAAQAKQAAQEASVDANEVPARQQRCGDSVGHGVALAALAGWLNRG